MEELTENAEEPDEGESKQSEQKLGKLQYKVIIGFLEFLNHFWNLLVKHEIPGLYVLLART